MTLLSVQDLRTYFKTDDGIVKAVDGVSFNIEEGETLGLVGESGSGKSVMSMSLLRLVPEPPAFFPSGRVLFEGQDLLSMPQGQIAKIRGDRLAMIFQDPMTSLNPFLTIERQLTEVLEQHRGLSRKAAITRAIDMLTRVGIPDPQQRITQYPHQFSGGMRQRVMIAMALLCEPKLLIADEPTTALDVTIQAQILELLRDLKRDFNTAIILITHDLGVVAGMADRLMVMYAGKIVEASGTEALYESPQHPYTRGLLQSVPRLDDEARADLVPIQGLPPDLSRLPGGCPFHPRCPVAMVQCAHHYPPQVHLKNRWSACWNTLEAVK